MLGKLLKGETFMKLKTALNKIKKHLKGEDYVLEKNYGDQGINGDLVIYYQNYIVSMTIQKDWKMDLPEDLDQCERAGTEEEFMKYGNVSLFHKRRENDHSDLMTDYFAGSFYDNLSQTLESLKRSEGKYPAGTLIRFRPTKRMQRWGCANELGIVTKSHGKIYDIVMTKSNVEQTYISERDIQPAY